MKNRVKITENQFKILEKYINNFLLSESFKFKAKNLSKWVFPDGSKTLKNFESLSDEIDVRLNSKFDEDMSTPKYYDTSKNFLEYPLGGGKYITVDNEINKLFTEMLDESLGKNDFTEVENFYKDIASDPEIKKQVNLNNKFTIEYLNHLRTRIDEIKDAAKKQEELKVKGNVDVKDAPKAPDISEPTMKKINEEIKITKINQSYSYDAYENLLNGVTDIIINEVTEVRNKVSSSDLPDEIKTKINDQIINVLDNPKWVSYKEEMRNLYSNGGTWDDFRKMQDKYIQEFNKEIESKYKSKADPGGSKTTPRPEKPKITKNILSKIIENSNICEKIRKSPALKRNLKNFKLSSKDIMTNNEILNYKKQVGELPPNILGKIVSIFCWYAGVNLLLYTVYPILLGVNESISSDDFKTDDPEIKNFLDDPNTILGTTFDRIGYTFGLSNIFKEEGIAKLGVSTNTKNVIYYQFQKQILGQMQNGLKLTDINGDVKVDLSGKDKNEMKTQQTANWEKVKNLWKSNKFKIEVKTTNVNEEYDFYDVSLSEPITFGDKSIQNFIFEENPEDLDFGQRIGVSTKYNYGKWYVGDAYTVVKEKNETEKNNSLNEYVKTKVPALKNIDDVLNKIEYKTLDDGLIRVVPKDNLSEELEWDWDGEEPVVLKWNGYNWYEVIYPNQGKDYKNNMKSFLNYLINNYGINFINKYNSKKAKISEPSQDLTDNISKYTFNTDEDFGAGLSKTYKFVEDMPIIIDDSINGETPYKDNIPGFIEI